MDMDGNTKLEVAKEIMAAMIAERCKEVGFNKNDELLMQLVKEGDEVSRYNIDTVDKAINVYGPIVKGEHNEN